MVWLQVVCYGTPQAQPKGRQEAEAALVSSGTTIPPSPGENPPWLLGVAGRAVHLLQFLEPPSSPPPPNGWTTNPLLHEWRPPSSKGEHVRTPGSTNRHTISTPGKPGSANPRIPPPPRPGRLQQSGGPHLTSCPPPPPPRKALWPPRWRGPAGSRAGLPLHSAVIAQPPNPRASRFAALGQASLLMLGTCAIE